jgi:hypothetical protein
MFFFAQRRELEREIATSCMSKQFLDPLWCSLQDIFVARRKRKLCSVVKSFEERKNVKFIKLIYIFHGLWEDEKFLVDGERLEVMTHCDDLKIISFVVLLKKVSVL